MNSQKMLGFVFVLLIGFLDACVAGELSAHDIMEKTNEAVADAPFILRTDTNEQTAVTFFAGKKVEQPQRTEARIEIDRKKGMARQSGQANGQEIVMIKYGDKAAMKLGPSPWQVPTGPYGALAEDMGNLFVCEREVPESEENAPRLKIVGTESIDGVEAIVIESEGNSAAPLAEARMIKGIEKAFSAVEPAQRPLVKVLEYSSKQWIAKSGYRRLQNVQTSKVRMSMPLPNGQEQVIESSTKTTSRYNYQKVVIDVPEDAKKILFKKE